MVANKKKRFLLLLFAMVTLVLIVNTAFAAMRTFHVQETDLVKIAPDAVDPDSDKITFTYSEPFNEKGEWQTGYDDAGQYDVEIKASDGFSETIQKILVIVDNKNQPPFLSEKKLVVKETQTVNLRDVVTDPDDDVLSFVLDPPFDRYGKWETTFGDRGFHVVSFSVNDGEFNVKERVEIEVLPTNQPPEISDSFSESESVRIDEDEELLYWVEAADGDGNSLSYRWELDERVIGEESKGTYQFGFESSGDHNLKVIISDGTIATESEWNIIIKNVNRRPELDFLPVTVNEGEKIVLEVPDMDEDGDVLEYSFSKPFNEKGEWQTNYEDAGAYTILVTVSDGDFVEEVEVGITILDVDREPSLHLPEKLEVNEGEKLLWRIDTSDPDGDEITITIENIPVGAIIEQKNKTLSWTPSYDVIKRRGGFFSDILNTIRLEHFLLRKKTFPLTVTSCGKELCTSGTINLIIHHVNRPPVLARINDLNVTELETVKLEVSAADPDGDIVRYYFTQPLTLRGGEWKTTYDDEGINTVYVTATDGRAEQTMPVQINVLKNNRVPVLEIKNEEIVVNEGREFGFRVTATDLDMDELNIRLDYLPPGASFVDGLFIWQPSYDVVKNRTSSTGIWSRFISGSGYLNKKFSKDKADVWLSFIASDGEVDTVQPVKVTVKNVNQGPRIVDFLPAEALTVRINEPVIFHIAAADDDYEPLSYVWDFGFTEQKVVGTDTIERTFVTPGSKQVKVKISDGLEEIEKVWNVQVIGVEETELAAEPEISAGGPAGEPAPTFKVYVIKTRS